jgi:hypothetical protein
LTAAAAGPGISCAMFETNTAKEKRNMDRTRKIRELNDAFRCYPAEGGVPGRALLTQGICALPLHDQMEIINRVRCFEDFTEDNDPYGEHNFGNFTYAGKKLFWKIDYYDQNILYASSDPSDPQLTCRVLTIMLAQEY